MLPGVRQHNEDIFFGGSEVSSRASGLNVSRMSMLLGTQARTHRKLIDVVPIVSALGQGQFLLGSFHTEMKSQCMKEASGDQQDTHHLPVLVEQPSWKSGLCMLVTAGADLCRV